MDLDQSPERPDICIGTDNFHTPKELIDVFTNTCAAADWSVAVDRPYAGTLVPSKHYRRDPRVMSMMVEVNRRLYLVNEPEDVSKSASWPGTRDAILASIHEAVATARKIMPQTNTEIGI